MIFNSRIEQAGNGKIALYGIARPITLSYDQVRGLGIDVHSLDHFDQDAYKRAYLLEDAINAGLPAPQPGRYAFFRDLLEQRKSMLQTPQRDAEISLLEELIEELPKDWMSYRNRPAQKFVGRLSAVIGNADKVVFETSGGQLLLEVSYNSSLRKFIMEDEDIERHRRYDMDISTNLVASVKDTTLVALEWQVQWDEDAPVAWRLLDEDKLQCVRVIHDGEHIYEFVQANAYPNGIYRYTNAFISMKRYAPEEITQALHDRGFIGMADFRGACGGKVDWLRLAELFVEREAHKPENEVKRDLTFEEAKQKIEKETGLVFA